MPPIDYLHRYLEIAPFSHALWRYLEIEKVRKINLKSPVLDIGCGFGEFAAVYYDKPIDVGIDISAENIYYAAKKNIYKRLLQADARKLPFKNNSFQTIVSISTIEHIKNNEEVFSEAYRVLKPKGHLVITVPTTAMNDMLLVPFPKKKWLNLYHSIFLHHSLVSKNRWLEKIRSAGFMVLQCEGTMSHKQLLFYELFLPLALPTQLYYLMFKKRILFSTKQRIYWLSKLYTIFLANSKPSDANIFIYAQK